MYMNTLYVSMLSWKPYKIWLHVHFNSVAVWFHLQLILKKYSQNTIYEMSWWQIGLLIVSFSVIPSAPFINMDSL